MYHIFSQALDKQKEIRVVFCDISKAFDRVWHPGLLAKLAKVGISGKLLEWFENYLTGRLQRVVINGQTSSWGTISAGVPQGSVLGPLLFLVYINDITEAVEHSEVRLFADDTILYLFVDNPVSNAAALNRDLQHINDWANHWLVKFSPSKTKTMTLTRKRKKKVFPKLYMSGTPLNEVTSHKHLGVTLSKDLSWNSHIEDVVSRASQSLDVLNALKHKLDRCTLEKLYNAFIRSKLEYANIVFDNCSEQQADLLENIQYRAAKIVSGAIHRVSHSVVYAELGWDSLKERRRKQRLKVFFKASNDETPAYFTNVIPEQNVNEQYDLRNNDDLVAFRSKSKSFERSFFPQSTSDFNSLPARIKSCSTTEEFMRELTKDREKPPQWYLVGDRQHNCLHTKLRMLCSPLNDHLYSHIHVVDNPDCMCGHLRENNKHFLLECPLYDVERAEMIAHLNDINFQPTLSNLLHGDPKASVKINTDAFLIVQKFIKESKRFA